MPVAEYPEATAGPNQLAETVASQNLCHRHPDTCIQETGILAIFGMQLMTGLVKLERINKSGNILDVATTGDDASSYRR